MWRQKSFLCKTDRVQIKTFPEQRQKLPNWSDGISKAPSSMQTKFLHTARPRGHLREERTVEIWAWFCHAHLHLSISCHLSFNQQGTILKLYSHQDGCDPGFTSDTKPELMVFRVLGQRAAKLMNSVTSQFSVCARIKHASRTLYPIIPAKHRSSGLTTPLSEEDKTHADEWGSRL